MSPLAASLEGKVVLVTGGNSGIGAAMATALAEAGAAVAIWGRRGDRNDAVVSGLTAAGAMAVGRVVDVSDETAVIAAAEEIVGELGRIDGVIACAGFARRGSSVLDCDQGDFEAVIDVNLFGALYALREGMRHMVRRAEGGEPGGSLVAIGSLLTHTGMTGLASYGIAKSGLQGLVRNLAVEGGPHGIRANLVCPGYIETPPSEARASDPDFPVTRMLRESSPAGRWGRPEDLQGIACYLISDASAYHSGDTITIDGGLLARTPQ